LERSLNVVKVKGSKPINEIVKGDKMKVDGKEYEVDSHYVMIDHGMNNEMAIELFDVKAKEDEGDFQIRYFDDRVEESIAFYELKAIVYESVDVKKIEW
jgi:hypothetical protein